MPIDIDNQGLPHGWIKINLEEAGSWCSGGTPSRKRHEFFGKGINWIKSGDLTDGLITQVEEQITQEGLENSRYYFYCFIWSNVWKARNFNFSGCYKSGLC